MASIFSLTKQKPSFLHSFFLLPCSRGVDPNPAAASWVSQSAEQSNTVRKKDQKNVWNRELHIISLACWGSGDDEMKCFFKQSEWQCLHKWWWKADGFRQNPTLLVFKHVNISHLLFVRTEKLECIGCRPRPVWAFSVRDADVDADVWENDISEIYKHIWALVPHVLNIRIGHEIILVQVLCFACRWGYGTPQPSCRISLKLIKVIVESKKSFHWV